MGVRLKYRTVVFLVSPAHFGWLRGGFRHGVPLKLVDEFADTSEVPPFYKKKEKITMRHMENTSDSIALLRGHIDPRRVQRRTPLKRTLLEFSMSKFQPLHTRIGIRMFVRSYCCITLQFEGFLLIFYLLHSCTSPCFKIDSGTSNRFKITLRDRNLVLEYLNS